jgi:hypothetical protein
MLSFNILISYSSQNTTSTSYGAHPSGQIIYTPDFYMSANIMSTTPTDRPVNITYPSKDNDTDHDWAQVGKHTMSYAGPWSVTWGNETSGELVHGPLTFSAAPGWFGTPQRRNYTIYEGRKVLNLWTVNKDTGNVARLWWRKLGT